MLMLRTNRAIYTRRFRASLMPTEIVLPWPNMPLLEDFTSDTLKARTDSLLSLKQERRVADALKAAAERTAANINAIQNRKGKIPLPQLKALQRELKATEARLRRKLTGNMRADISGGFDLGFFDNQENILEEIEKQFGLTRTAITPGSATFAKISSDAVAALAAIGPEGLSISTQVANMTAGIQTQMSNKILEGVFNDGDEILVDEVDGEYAFERAEEAAVVV